MPVSTDWRVDELAKSKRNAYIYQYILLKMCLLIMNLSAQVLLLVLFTQHIFKTCLGKNWFFNELFVTKISLANFSLSKYLLSYFLYLTS